MTNSANFLPQGVTAKNPPRTPSKTPSRAPQSSPAKPHGLGKDELVLSSKSATQAQQPAQVAVKPPQVDTPEQAIDLALKGEEVRLLVTDGKQSDMKITLLSHETYVDTYEIVKRNVIRRTYLPVGLTIEDVRKKYWDAAPMSLSIRQSGQSPTADSYDVALGEFHLNLSVGTGADVRPVLTRLLASYADVPDKLRKSFLSLNMVDGQDAATGQIKTLSGETLDVTVRRKGTEAGVSSYDLEFGGHTLQFRAPQEHGFPWEAGWIVQQYLLEPAQFRHMLKTVQGNDGPNPTDEAFAKQFNRKTFSAAATAGNGGINFWNGYDNMQPEVIHHEFGHVMGQHFDTGSYHPVGWEDAIKADNQWVSDYAKETVDEDFAETWMTYQSIQNHFARAKGAPMTMEEFIQRYPHRAAIIEAIASGERKPVQP